MNSPEIAKYLFSNWSQWPTTAAHHLTSKGVLFLVMWEGILLLIQEGLYIENFQPKGAPWSFFQSDTPGKDNSLHRQDMKQYFTSSALFLYNVEQADSS